MLRKAPLSTVRHRSARERQFPSWPMHKQAAELAFREEHWQKSLLTLGEERHFPSWSKHKAVAELAFREERLR